MVQFAADLKMISLREDIMVLFCMKKWCMQYLLEKTLDKAKWWKERTNRSSVEMSLPKIDLSLFQEQ